MLQSKVYIFLIFVFALPACSSQQEKIYTSECAPGIKFKKVGFVNLIDSLKFYDNQYVEVSGRYLEGKNMSALVNDSTFKDHGNKHAFWVNFTQDCPLYLAGKHTGLFESEDGEYNKLNNRLMTLRGHLQVKKKGHKNAYPATINEVSYLSLK